jgi:hypothetical protein
MGVVALRLPPSASHVRTARLVAVAVARRLGMDEVRLDEVRLAVGEVCARAVRRCLGSSVSLPVSVVMDDGHGLLTITVTDHATWAGGGPDEAVALALVRGLADEVEVEDGPSGPAGVVRMTWHAVRAET